jgi:hypothetical protein
MKMKSPNSKFQLRCRASRPPEKYQNSNPKVVALTQREDGLEFDGWSFTGAWSLELGAF